MHANALDQRLRENTYFAEHLMTRYLRFPFRFAAAITLFVFAPLCSAQSTATQPSDRWSDLFLTAMSTAMCRDSAPFKSCTTLTQQKCEELALSSTRVCLAKNKDQIPKQMTKEDGRHWGAVVGECSGTAFYGTAMYEHAVDEACFQRYAKSHQ